MANNKPTDTLKDGLLSATIWQGTSAKGVTFYTVTLSRSYKDEKGEWHDSSSFSGAEVLQISRLASRAYDRIHELVQENRLAEQS